MFGITTLDNHVSSEAGVGHSTEPGMHAWQCGELGMHFQYEPQTGSFVDVKLPTRIYQRTADQGPTPGGPRGMHYLECLKTSGIVHYLEGHLPTTSPLSSLKNNV